MEFKFWFQVLGFRVGSWGLVVQSWGSVDARNNVCAVPVTDQNFGFRVKRVWCRVRGGGRLSGVRLEEGGGAAREVKSCRWGGG